MSAPVVRAIVDLGTNSVKVLVARITGDIVEPLHEQSVQTRLGRGLYDTQRLAAEGIAATAEVLRDYRSKADELGAESFRVLATSAARDAHNAGELRTAIQQAAGAELEIVSGEREAELVYRGVRSQTERAGRTILAVDVGGGSTEFILGDDATPRFAASHPIGTVRMLARLKLADPPGDAAMAECLAGLRQLVAAEVGPRLQPALAAVTERPLEVVGPGGTTTFLARIHHATDRFDRTRFEATRFTVAELRELTRRLWLMTQTQREHLKGLPPNRTDVILLGTAIYLAVLEEFSIPHLRVSTRGLRFGALMPA